MKIVAGVATDTGQVRDHNEDSFIVEPPLYAIADGMGGANAGEVASQLALETIGDMQRAGETTLDDEVREANRVVFARSGEDTKFAGMGTTVTAALASAEALHLVHVGDSRAYLLRAGSLRQLTHDHTLVDRMVQAGEISRDEADVHPHRNVLIRALGTEPKVDVEALDLGLLDGDQVLICSDGLTDMVTENQITAILDIARGAPQDAAERLVRAANRAGGIDNITAIVLEVEPGEPDEGTVAEAPPGAGATGHRVPWRAITIVLTTIVLLLVAYTVFRSYLDRQWYLGVSNGHVALFQGIPAAPFGIPLSHVDLDTGLDAATIEKLHYDTLPEGITFDSREEALTIVQQMQDDLEQRQQQQNQHHHHQQKKNGGGGGQ
jgi:protein phosphatase